MWYHCMLIFVLVVYGLQKCCFHHPASCSSDQQRVRWSIRTINEHSGNFDNSIRYGKQSIYFFFLNYKFFIATQGVGSHHKELSNNKLPVHQSFKITHIDNSLYKCKEN